MSRRNPPHPFIGGRQPYAPRLLSPSDIGTAASAAGSVVTISVLLIAGTATVSVAAGGGGGGFSQPVHAGRYYFLPPPNPESKPESIDVRAPGSIIKIRARLIVGAARGDAKTLPMFSIKMVSIAPGRAAMFYDLRLMDEDLLQIAA